MINKHVKEMDYPEYGGAKPRARLDLSTSENPLKPNLVVNVDFNRYSSSQDRELLEKLSFKCGVGRDNILLTAGCDGGLNHIAETLVDEGDKVLIPCPSFGRYEFHTKMMKGIPEFVYFQGEFSVEKIIEYEKQKKPKLLFLGNPNNPTGNYMSLNKILQILDNVNSMVVVDEALIDYVGEEYSIAKFVNDYSNLIVARSFSKLYGMAGLRAGYLIANKELIADIAKTVSPFEVNSYAVEMAKKVLDAKSYLEKSRKHVEEGLKVLDNSGFYVVNSCTSVALLKGENVYECLLEKGILTVSGENFRGLDKNYARVCVKGPEEMREVVSALLLD